MCPIGGSSPQLTSDLTVDASLLAGEGDAQGLWHVVATIALVGIGPLDLAPRQLFGFRDDLGQGVTVITVAGRRFGVCMKRPALARRLALAIDTFTPNSSGL